MDIVDETYDLLTDESFSLVEVEKNFATISVLVDDACAAARLRQHVNPNFLDGERINWRDLFCRNVSLGLDQLGRPYYTAYVKEANESAKGLKDFIYNWVKLHGYEVRLSFGW